MSKGQTLRDLVMKRMVVAADEIFALFERTIAEYEEEVLRSKLSLETHNKGVQTLSLNLEVGPSPEHIKEEQTLCIKQEEEPPLEFPLTSVSVKTEDNVEKSFLLQQEPPEENREEPGCSLYLQSDKDKQTYSCSDTDDSDDWEPSAKRSTTCDGQEPKTVHRKDSKRGRAKQTQLQKQMKIHNGPFMCPVCKMTFKYKSSVNRHLNTHKEEKFFSCSVCEKSFSRKLYLKRHMASHMGEKHFNCPACKRGFGQKYHLKEHMKTHTGEKPFSCPECGLKYKHYPSILRHISIVHRGERPHNCPVCKKAFAQKSYLITHMRMHTGEKPYSCTICKKRFLDKSYLKKHLSRHRTHVVDKTEMKN